MNPVDLPRPATAAVLRHLAARNVASLRSASRGARASIDSTLGLDVGTRTMRISLSNGMTSLGNALTRVGSAMPALHARFVGRAALDIKTQNTEAVSLVCTALGALGKPVAITVTRSLDAGQLLDAIRPCASLLVELKVERRVYEAEAADLVFVDELPRLERLELRDATLLDALTTLGVRAPALRHLSLGEESRPTPDVGELVDALGCTAMETLTLQDLDAPDYRALSEGPLADSLRELTIGIGPSDFAGLERLRRLRRVHIRSRRRPDGRVVVNHPRPATTDMRRLISLPDIASITIGRVEYDARTGHPPSAPTSE